MTKILIEIDTDTQRVVQIATQEDRSYPEDEKHENGNYFNTCYHCGRTFVGHKRRAVCKVCAAAPQPEPVDAIANFLHQFKRHVGGDGEFWLHELEDFYDVISQGEQKPTLICPRCKVDRFKSPCPDNSMNCPIHGEAQGERK